jgi:tetratricopeptide (TPR) repeat protein
LVRAGCPTGWVAQPVSLYRFHRQQMTGNSAQMSEATFAVLDKIFADPALPVNWQEMRAAAYANAYLRTAAQAYHVQNFEHGQQCLDEAIRLNPSLVSNGASTLVNRFHAWASSPKIPDAHQYLEKIYDNLPSSLSHLGQTRRQELSRAALHQLVTSYQRGDMQATRALVLKALRYNVRWLRNRELLIISLRAWQQLLVPRWI